MAINSNVNVHELVVCANMFIRKDDKYLVLKRSPKKIHAPNVIHPVGGKVEPNEGALEAALREAFEETGVKVKNVRLEAVINEVHPPSVSVNWLIFHFSGDFDSGEVTATDEGELMWLTSDEIKQQEMFSSVDRIVDQMLDPGTGPVFASFFYDAQQNVDDSRSIIQVCAR
jgi:8-oxo-dGTP diphosphatase